MDIDWCLTCNKRVEGNSLYCSFQCQHGAGPSNHYRRSVSSLAIEQHPSDYLQECAQFGDEFVEDFDDYDEDSHNIEAVSKTNWAGRGSAGIRAWAAEIPLGAHPETLDSLCPSPPPPTDDSFSVSSSSSMTSSTYRAPNLVRPSRPLPPSLTMSKPERSTTTPPRPILNLQKHLAAISLTHSSGSTPRTSVASEDSLPTPASTPAMPFSSHPGRPFPSISEARASDLAACTQLPTLSPLPSQKDKDSFLVRSRAVPIAPRIISSPRSSQRDDADDDYDLSPPWWVTGSMVARHATKVAATKPHSSNRKQSIVPEISRGRKISRVAA